MSESMTPLARVLAVQGRRQDWLAARAGYSRIYVHRLAKGRLPMTAPAAERLAPVLGVMPETLLPPREARQEAVDAADD